MESKPESALAYPISSRSSSGQGSGSASQTQSQHSSSRNEGSLPPPPTLPSFQQQVRLSSSSMVHLNPFFASPVNVSFDGIAHFAPIPLPPLPLPLPLQQHQVPVQLPFPAAEHPLPPPISAATATSQTHPVLHLSPPSQPPTQLAPPPPYSPQDAVEQQSLSTSPMQALPPLMLFNPLAHASSPPSASASASQFAASPLAATPPLPPSVPLPGPSFPVPFATAGGGGGAPVPPPPFPPGLGFGLAQQQQQYLLQQQHLAHAQQQQLGGYYHPAQMPPLSPWPPIPLRNIDDFLAQGQGGMSTGEGGTGGARGTGAGGGGGKTAADERYFFPPPHFNPLHPQYQPPAAGQMSVQQQFAALPNTSAYPPSSSSVAAAMGTGGQQAPVVPPGLGIGVGVGVGIGPASPSSAAPPPPSAPVALPQPPLGFFPLPVYSPPPPPPPPSAGLPLSPTRAAATAAMTTTGSPPIPRQGQGAPTHVPPTSTTSSGAVANGDAAGGGGNGGVGGNGGGGGGGGNGTCQVGACAAGVACELSPCGCRLCRDHLGWVLRGGVEIPPSPALDGQHQHGAKKPTKHFKCVACGRRSTKQHPTRPAALPARGELPTATDAQESPGEKEVKEEKEKEKAAAFEEFSIKYFSAGPAPGFVPPSASSPPPPPLSEATQAQAQASPPPETPTTAQAGWPYSPEIFVPELFSPAASPVVYSYPSHPPHPSLAYGQVNGQANAFRTTHPGSDPSSSAPGFAGADAFGTGAVGREEGEEAARGALELHGYGEPYGGLLPPFEGYALGGPEEGRASAEVSGRELAAPAREKEAQRPKTALPAPPPPNPIPAPVASPTVEGKDLPPHQARLRPQAAAAETKEREREARSRAATAPELSPYPPPRAPPSQQQAPPRTPSPKIRPPLQLSSAPGPGDGKEEEEELSPLSTPSVATTAGGDLSGIGLGLGISSPSGGGMAHSLPNLPSIGASGYRTYSGPVPPPPPPPGFVAISVPAAGMPYPTPPPMMTPASSPQQPVLRAARGSTSSSAGGYTPRGAGRGRGSFSSSSVVASSSASGSAYAFPPSAVAAQEVASGSNPYHSASSLGLGLGLGLASPFASPSRARAERTTGGGGGAGAGGGGEARPAQYPISSSSSSSPTATVRRPEHAAGRGRGWAGALPTPQASPTQGRTGGGAGEGGSPVRAIGRGYGFGAAGGGRSATWTPMGRRESAESTVDEEGAGGGDGSASARRGSQWQGAWPVVKVENIPFDTALRDVLDWLPHGYLASKEDVVMPVHIVLHRATGRTLPHCYLEVVSPDAAYELISRMDRSQLGNRTVRVKMERPGEMMRDFFDQDCFFQQPSTISYASTSRSRALANGPSANSTPTVSPHASPNRPYQVQRSFTSPAAAPLPHLPPGGWTPPDVLLKSEDLRLLWGYCQKVADVPPLPCADEQVTYRERPYERAFYNMVSLVAKFPWQLTDLWDDQLRDEIFQAAQLVAGRARVYKDDNPLFQDVLDKLVGVVLDCPAFTVAQKITLNRLAPSIAAPSKPALTALAAAPAAPTATSSSSVSPASAGAVEGTEEDVFLDAVEERVLSASPDKDDRIEGKRDGDVYPPSPPYYRSTAPVARRAEKREGPEWTVLGGGSGGGSSEEKEDADFPPLPRSTRPSPTSLSPRSPTLTRPASAHDANRDRDRDGLPETPPASPVVERDKAGGTMRAPLKGWASQD
ncbi:hypothetical protein JCM8097_007751 [Rhodosporidiobolus ruineniae]